MLCNIIDHRKSPYRWAKVNAVIENTSHDNGVDNADFIEAPNEHGVLCDDRDDISLNDAIVWAQSQKVPVTLFIYDAGDDNQ